MCGTYRVTDTIETETGIKALCAEHAAAVADHYHHQYAAQQADHRHRARQNSA